jgi:DNA mismatch repair protein MutL
MPGEPPSPSNPERPVRVLPTDLANQIAAGEVVERPASAVKELVENALDAGASRVQVELEAGGAARIAVSDDGGGMSEADARLAVLRHATSKLTEFGDLSRLGTFGFRGEALPSIASVSRFSLRTRRRSDDAGTEVRIEGGGEAVVRPCGVAPGTVVEVTDLFFNVPARRKFLRSVGAEAASVREVIEAASLAEPHVGFTLRRDGKKVLDLAPASSREERVRALFAGEPLSRCAGERGPVQAEAFLAPPQRARASGAELLVFVNGRPVRDKVLARMAALAYGSVLERGRFPVGVVFVDVPPALVDVNVHPQKSEVRFEGGRAVPDAVLSILGRGLREAFGLADERGADPLRDVRERNPLPAPRDAWVWDAPAPLRAAESTRSELPLGEASTLPPVAPASARPPKPLDDEAPGPLTGSPRPLAPTVPAGRAPLPTSRSPERPAGPSQPESRSPHAPEPAEAGQSKYLDHRESARQPLVAKPSESPAAPALTMAGPANPVRTGPPDAPAGFGFASLRYIGQARNTYLLCEGPDGVYVLDQHAAAERVTFHRLRAAYAERSGRAQRLLLPVVLPATAAEVARVEEAQAELDALGLDLRPAGATQVAVHAVPVLLARCPPERLARDLLDELGEGERAFSRAIDLALATMACHGSLRAGDPVAPEEAKALLRSLDEVDFAGHCPHGRPIVSKLGFHELEHKVGRR